MKLILQILVALISFVYLLEVASTANKSDEQKLNPQWSYCFEFTWLGPNYDNTTKFNETCSDYLEESGAKGIPCNPPFVITYNGTFPDIDYLWKYHQSSIVCRRASGQVCARYAYYQNGASKSECIKEIIKCFSTLSHRIWVYQFSSINASIREFTDMSNQIQALKIPENDHLQLETTIILANATYMCTKVQVAGEEAVKKGCFTQKVRDYEVEVCACVSGKGPYKPCNIHF